ncbi:hypothetical protein Tco_0311595 [Tanacetum coccineum]
MEYGTLIEGTSTSKKLNIKKDSSVGLHIYLIGYLEDVQMAHSQQLKSEFEKLVMKEDESINSFAGKMMSIITKAATYGLTFDEQTKIRSLSFLRTLLSSLEEKESRTMEAFNIQELGGRCTSADGSENSIICFWSPYSCSFCIYNTPPCRENSPQIQTLDYSGRSLSYYITNFKPSEIVQISVPTETVPSVQTESSTPQLDYVAPETDICTAGELYPANGYRSFRNQDLCANGELYPAIRIPSNWYALNEGWTQPVNCCLMVYETKDVILIVIFVLRRPNILHDSIEVVRYLDDLRAGLEPMDMMAVYQEGAYKRLCR